MMLIMDKFISALGIVKIYLQLYQLLKNWRILIMKYIES